MKVNLNNSFNTLLAQMDASLFQACSQTILANKNELVDGFYAVLLKDRESSIFLVATAVEKRLKPVMAKWLEQLITCDSAEKFEALKAFQYRIGEAHGRAEIPVYLVLRAMNHLKQACFQLIEKQAMVVNDFMCCFNFYQSLFEISIEIMTQSSILQEHDHAGHGVSLKLLEALFDPINEKERQLHALSQWESQIFFEAAINQPVSISLRLGFSPFALWLTHKAAMHFDTREDFKQIIETIAQIDQTTLSSLMTVTPSELPTFERTSLLLTLRSQVSQIRLLLSNMFDQLKAMDAGQDPLTQLLNIRFLPAIFQREIKLARQNSINFAVAMIDIDYFKRVNDNYGHDAGDLALKQVAFVLQRQVRASDFLFRYGGEEFLLILVEVSAEQALAITEQLRQTVENLTVNLPSGDAIKATVSIGVTLNSGHSDYEHIVQCADEALYRAKSSGRNRVVLA